MVLLMCQEKDVSGELPSATGLGEARGAAATPKTEQHLL